MSDGSEKHPRTNMLWSVSTKNDDCHVLFVCPKYRNLKRKPSTPFLQTAISSEMSCGSPRTLLKVSKYLFWSFLSIQRKTHLIVLINKNVPFIDTYILIFFFAFAYTTSPAAVIKLVVFFRSSNPPYTFWWSGVADGHCAIGSGWCLLHLWRTCSLSSLL